MLKPAGPLFQLFQALSEYMRQVQDDIEQDRFAGSKNVEGCRVFFPCQAELPNPRFAGDSDPASGGQRGLWIPFSQRVDSCYEK